MKYYLAVLLLFNGFISRSQSIDHGDYFTSFDTTRIYYEVRGAGYPVVLVHGFTGSVESWKQGILYKELVEKGYQVISLDLRGSGKSDKPQQFASYQHDAEANDVMTLATHLKLKGYHAVGYSRGSIIVSRVALKDQRVTSVVMGGMGDGFMNPQWPRRIMFYKALSNQESSPEVAPLIKSIRERGLDQVSLANQQGAQPSTSAAEFATLKKPALIICGDQDNDNGSAAALCKFLPKGKLVIVPGDHGTTSRSQEFSAAVVRFLKDNE